MLPTTVKSLNKVRLRVVEILSRGDSYVNNLEALFKARDIQISFFSPRVGPRRTRCAPTFTVNQ